MVQPQKIRPITVEEYLKLEEAAHVRHECVRGQIFAMSGATEGHNIICGNLHATLHAFLRGTGCRVFQNDMKVHIKAADCFYYPDIMITCEPVQAAAVFKESPLFIAEVISPSTKQIDRREKLAAYRQLKSLKYYVLVHQNRMVLEAYCRSATSDEEWDFLQLHRDDELQVDIFQSGPLLIPVSSIYNGLNITSTVEEPEEEYEFTNNR